MMPINLQIKRMIKKRVPSITEENIQRYENLELLRFHINLQNNINPNLLKVKPTRGKTYDNLFDEKETEDITRPFEDEAKNLKYLHKLWIARRRLALTQGKYFMPPYPRKNLILWLKALAACNGLQLRSFFQLIYLFYVNNFKKMKTKQAKVN